MLDPLTIGGGQIISGLMSAGSSDAFCAVNARSHEPVAPNFLTATEREVSEACSAAADAFIELRKFSVEDRAVLLETIAAGLEAISEPLTERASLESGLPLPRLTGELGRTCGQLRMFADLIRDGSWVDARIDLPKPERVPVPKPDLRRMLRPIGPIAVFGASNFPLAFSVAGGDTASALAAGCPVVVKAHPAHPGTSEIVGRVIAQSLSSCGLPLGMFAMLQGGIEVGEWIVQDPHIKAVGFTGSLRAGRALFDLANARSRPIPVFAEMGSVNPVIFLPGAIEDRPEALAQSYAESLILGVGQFCTNPGLVFGLSSGRFSNWLEMVALRLDAAAVGTMLTPQIGRAYEAQLRDWSANPILTRLTERESAAGVPALFTMWASEIVSDPALSEECFGPAAIAAVAEDYAEMVSALSTLGGQLTATVHAGEGDEAMVRDLVPLLEEIAGRVILNGYPTGVEVCSSMQHGGPYPASTDSRFTSVGTGAITRWVRPVAYQGFPQNMLPEELRDENPRQIQRLVDGQPESRLEMA